ncbi:MAG: hypothetical protein Athens071416_68 [Parcubacteria group bacterium Athens0714_16]|nr:MAG: hypothetical protein Athens071416_68 [Parcubacteria group bacterium Athens0714_16]
MYFKIEKIKIVAWGMASFLLLFPLYWANAEDVNVTGQLTNPLGTTKTVPALITKILTDIVTPIGSVVIIFFIIYAGFLFVKAQGKPEEITKAKEILLYVVIGAAVILGANLIAAVVSGTINNLK